ncbi:hypothetical protein AAK979_10895, partial [Ileibacterium valens]|uniref:hypothetical protein n=1 Tax=Ileibacterium valens TaxID=1862668 RepID=UPI0035143802
PVLVEYRISTGTGGSKPVQISKGYVYNRIQEIEDKKNRLRTDPALFLADNTLNYRVKNYNQMFDSLLIQLY